MYLPFAPSHVYRDPRIPERPSLTLKAGEGKSRLDILCPCFKITVGTKIPFPTRRKCSGMRCLKNPLPLKPLASSPRALDSKRGVV